MKTPAPLAIWLGLAMGLVVLAPSLARPNVAEAQTAVAIWNATSTGQAMSSCDIVVDRDGYAYVSELNHNLVHKFTIGGVYVTGWGGGGTGDTNFDGPRGMAVASNGNVYTVDTAHDRVQVFTSAGVHVMHFGSPGTGDGQFSNAKGIAIGPGDTVYVADPGSTHRVSVFTRDGVFVRKWSWTFAGGPVGIAVDGNGHVFTSDNGSSSGERIVEFSATGDFIRSWGTLGSGDGELNTPSFLALDGRGSLYVAETGNNRISVFDSTGIFVTKFGTQGSGLGQLRFPTGVWVDASFNVYVADWGNSRVEVFSPAVTAVEPHAADARLQMAPPSPNPTRGATVLRFSLPRACEASLAVYDLAGRQVSTPLDRQRLSAGLNDVVIDTARFDAGIYFARLAADGRVGVTRLVVAK